MSGSVTIPLTPSVAPVSNLPVVAHINRTTAFDIQERLSAYLGHSTDKSGVRDERRAILDAYKEFANVHNWTYYLKTGRIQLHALFASSGTGPGGGLGTSPGTVQYQQSSGTYPFQLTITGDVWPSWVTRGFLRLPAQASGSSVVSFVDRQISATVVTLDPVSNPGSDIASGSAFSLAQDTFPLPADFTASDRGLIENNWGGMEYIRANDWMSSVRYLESYGYPRYYTFTGDPKVPGGLAIRMYPTPAFVQTMDYLYKRSARAILNFDVNAGTVSVNSGTAPQTVNLTGGNFLNNMAGSVLRIGADTKNLPTGLDGATPFLWEANITQVVNANQVIVDVPISGNPTGFVYRVSDPVDMEDQAMLSAFVKLCYMHVCQARIMKNLPQAQKDYLFHLELAKEADARDQSRQSASIMSQQRMRMAFMPRGADLS